MKRVIQTLLIQKESFIKDISQDLAFTKCNAELADKIFSATLEILHTIDEIDLFVPLNDDFFDSAFENGRTLAKHYAQQQDFIVHLSNCLNNFNNRCFEIIDSLISDPMDRSCLQFTLAKISSEIQQGFITGYYSFLSKKRNIQLPTPLPEKLTPQYVDNIIHKLSMIPMVELAFGGQLIYMNSAMSELQLMLKRKLTPEEILPKKYITEILEQSDKGKISKSMFRDITLDNHCYQQFILILPNTKIFIVFFIEAHKVVPCDNKNKICKIEEAPIFEQDELRKVKEAFLANMSHELRTPLHEIIGFADLLSEQFDGNLNDAQLEYVQMIQKGGERLLELINYLLIIGGKQGTESLIYSELPALEFCKELIRSLQNDITDKKLNVVLDPNENCRSFLADKDKLLLSLTEIMGYIIKYLSPCSKLVLTYFKDSNYTSFKITIPESSELLFSEEMVLSHATFFIDLMQGKFIVDTSPDNEKMFIIKIPGQ